MFHFINQKKKKNNNNNNNKIKLRQIQLPNQLLQKQEIQSNKNTQK